MSILLYYVILNVLILVAPHSPYIINFDQAILYLSAIVLLTFIVSLVLNYFVVFKKLDLRKSKRFLASLIVSAMTAPYFYFVSFGGFM